MKMKQVLLTALLAGAVCVSAQAQNFYPVLGTYSDVQKERLDKNYAIALNAGCDGLTESALAIVTMMKLDAPENEFSKIKGTIEDLTTDGETPVIRFKAYLAEAVYTNPEMFKEEAQRNFTTNDEFFSALADRMSKTLLSSK